MCSGDGPGESSEAKGAAGVAQEVTACAGSVTESTVGIVEKLSRDRNCGVPARETGCVGMGMAIVRSHGKLELWTVTVGMWGTMNEF